MRKNGELFEVCICDECKTGRTHGALPGFPVNRVRCQIRGCKRVAEWVINVRGMQV